MFVSFEGAAERRLYEAFGEEPSTLKRITLTQICDEKWTLNYKTCMQRLCETLFRFFFHSKIKVEKANLEQLLIVPLVFFWGLVLHYGFHPKRKAKKQPNLDVPDIHEPEIAQRMGVSKN